MKTYDIGIVGAGNSAHALAAYLSSKGHRITIYARRRESLSHVLRDGFVRAKGKLEGEFPVAQVVNSFKELCDSSPIILLATVATAYTEIVQGMAPFLNSLCQT